MRVARLYGPEDIRIEEMPVPKPGPRQAVLKTRASGICSGDVMPWYIEKKAPLVLGHEPSGEIVEIGTGVSGFRVGERVFCHHHAPCFVCERCRRGDYVQCDTWKRNGLSPGGISEYILIEQTTLEYDTLALPDSVSWEAGALIEPFACSVKAFRRSGIKRGDTVLVIGLGVMGMLNIIAARRLGASRVIGADMVPYRLEKASVFGADDVIDVNATKLSEALSELTSGGMANIVVVGPNSAAAMAEGIDCAAPGGTVVLFTPAKPGETLTLDPNSIYFKDISIVTSYSCGPVDTADALEMIEAGAVDAGELITHRYGIEDTREAYEKTREAKDSLKCMITFE